MLASRAQTGHDIDIAWYEVGRGEPVVLIHGLGDDHRAWRRVATELMLRRRVILYDFRGQGATPVGDADGTLAQLAGDLVVLLDAIGVEQATLAGFSLGGTIAMRTALDAPDRVAALALVATSSRVNSAAAQWYAQRAELVAADAPELRSVLDQDTADVYRQRPEEIESGRLIRRQATADPRGFANACRAMESLHDHPLDPELASIERPTVVVASEHDQHCPPKAGRIIADRIPGADLRIVEDAGHPIPVERPAEVVDAILSLPSRGE